MARERIQLKKIEKAAARHVTFSKRRKGLLKKAQELSILCEADVGLIIFSARGKLVEYSNTGFDDGNGSSRMARLPWPPLNPPRGFMQLRSGLVQHENQDLGMIKQEMENINCTLRHMDGKDLEGLTIKELQKLERTLEVGLRQIRSTKGNQYEEENARRHLEVEQLKQCSNLENNTALEFLLSEPRDHSQSSESIHNSSTSMSQHNEVSDTNLQLGLSISY